MKGTIAKGKTVQIEGPASVKLVSGKISILGATFTSGETIVIREGKCLPFQASLKTTFDVTLGEGAACNETNQETIPTSWEDAVTQTFRLKRPTTVMVIGEMNSGKSSFSTYLTNQALKTKRKVAIIDADLGQADLGPPTTIGFSHVTTPIKDLFDIKAENAYFVGHTSPSGASRKVIEGVTKLRNQVTHERTDILIINTDGWIHGETARRYKTRLVEKVAPNIVIGLTAHTDKEHLENLLSKLKTETTLTINTSPMLHRRNPEKRRIHRELGYKKYLKHAKVRSFPISLIKIEDSLLGNASVNTVSVQEIEDKLEVSPTYFRETPTGLFIVLKKNQSFQKKQIERIENRWTKKVKVITEGEEQGLLVGLLDRQHDFLGIGLLHGVNYNRKILKILTPVNRNVATIRFGQIKLDRNGKEMSLSTALTEYAA